MESDMKKFYVALVLVCFLGIVMGATIQSPDIQSAHSTVMVKKDAGHGSGVHVGDGYILTAAHVVAYAKKLTIEDEFNRIYKPEVMWSNNAYDVALLKIPATNRIQSSELICRDPKIGDPITVTGNPLDLRDITHAGLISGKAQKYGQWKEVILTNVSVMFGMSGGPVFDVHKRVIGIMVGFMDVSLGISPSWTDFSTIVPGSVICRLLGR